MAAREDEDYSDFLPWLRRKAGGEEISSTLSIGKSPHGGRGRGLFASKNIKKGHRMLKIPHSVQLSRVNLPSEINTLLGNKIDDNSALAVLLLHLQNREEWAPYMSRLPLLSKDMHSPVFWNDKELGMIEGNSGLYEDTVARKELIKKDFETVKSVLDTTLEQFTHAYQLVTSRAWVTITRGLVLVPFADFINHDPSSEVGLEEYESHSEIIADRDYAAGDEVVISYGHYSNATLLLNFGFTVPENHYDSYLFRLGLMDEDEDDARTVVIKNREDILPLIAFARHLSCGYQQTMEECYCPFQDDREKKAHKRLLDAIYEILFEHRRKLVQNMRVSTVVEVRKHLAVQLLQGEVRVLEHAISWLE